MLATLFSRSVAKPRRLREKETVGDRFRARRSCHENDNARGVEGEDGSGRRVRPFREGPRVIVPAGAPARRDLAPLYAQSPRVSTPQQGCGDRRLLLKLQLPQ